MKRLALLVVTTLIIFTGLPGVPAKAEEACDDIAGLGLVCLTVNDGQAIVTGPLGLSLSAPVPSPGTVIVEVPVPGATQTVQVPGPVRTVEVPGPTTVVTETQTVPPTATPTPTGRQRNESVPSQTSAPATMIETRVIESPGETITIVERIGYSIVGIVIGAILALLGYYLVYYLGRRNQERSFNAYLQDLTDLAMTRKR